MSELKNINYDGPALPTKKPGKTSKAQILSSVYFLKHQFIIAQMYEEAAAMRDMERKLEQQYGAKIVVNE